MKTFLQNIRQAFVDLVYGRQPPEPTPRIIILNIHCNERNLPINHIQSKNSSVPVKVFPRSDTVELTKQAVINQSDDSPVLLPFEDPALLEQFTKTNKDLVFKYILKRLKKAISNNMSSVSIFQFGTTRKLAQIGKPKYNTQLKLMMSWFIETEDYESAGICRDLLQQLDITDTID